MDAIRLTDAGRTTASIVAERGASSADPSDPVPDWERVVTEGYIRQKADDGVLAQEIICAKRWYTGSVKPERRAMEQLPVKLPIPEWRKRLKGTE
ncbi:hypothetical protein [Jannaschia rubra]|uniref:hypothetical protein n=1 Tax=Jannaschia rubra TaxID=282197 RepID=UPI002492A9C9|nr:hypothetical protein [Jannaschia rubra]